MELAVDRQADVPLGSQLGWQLQAAIADGRLARGERLPSVRALAASAGVNVNTVRAVYERLEREGFVRSEHGRGTFVAAAVPQARPEALRLYGAPAARANGPAPVTPDELARMRDELAGRLGQLEEIREELVALLAATRAALGEQAQPAAAPAKPVIRRTGLIV